MSEIHFGTTEFFETKWMMSDEHGASWEEIAALSGDNLCLCFEFGRQRSIPPGSATNFVILRDTICGFVNTRELWSIYTTNSLHHHSPPSNSTAAISIYQQNFYAILPHQVLIFKEYPLLNSVQKIDTRGTRRVRYLDSIDLSLQVSGLQHAPMMTISNILESRLFLGITHFWESCPHCCFMKHELETVGRYLPPKLHFHEVVGWHLTTSSFPFIIYLRKNRTQDWLYFEIELVT